MNDLLQILKKFSLHLQNEAVLKYLPFAAGVLIAAAVTVFLLKRADGKTLAETEDDRPQEHLASPGGKREPNPSNAAEIKPAESVRKTAPGQEPEKSKTSGNVAGLEKNRSGLLSKLEKIVSGGRMNGELWEQFEEMLILADAGTGAAVKIRKRVEKRLGSDSDADYEKIKNALMEEITELLKKTPAKPEDGETPRVFMVVGVNGTGKTTTAGKLAALFGARNKKVVLAAADTFRAAAAEQLEKWAERSGSEFVRGKPGADPSSVAFDAVKSAEAKKCDSVIIDTAGRLHTKTGLMDELAKIKKIAGKAKAGAPHEVLLVLDATTGQNAVRQAEMFDEAVGVTGIVLSKIDGTAKGGVLMAIAERFEIPFTYVGTGEKAEDIEEFDPVRFARSLFDEKG